MNNFRHPVSCPFCGRAIIQQIRSYKKKDHRTGYLATIRVYMCDYCKHQWMVSERVPR